MKIVASEIEASPTRPAMLVVNLPPFQFAGCPKVDVMGEPVVDNGDANRVIEATERIFHALLTSIRLHIEEHSHVSKWELEWAVLFCMSCGLNLPRLHEDSDAVYAFSESEDGLRYTMMHDTGDIILVFYLNPAPLA